MYPQKCIYIFFKINYLDYYGTFPPTTKPPVTII